MRFDVYGLLELEVRRAPEGWAVFRVGQGQVSVTPLKAAFERPAS